MKFVPSLRPKGTKVFPKMLWGELTAQGAYPADATLLSTSTNPCTRGVSAISGYFIAPGTPFFAIGPSWSAFRKAGKVATVRLKFAGDTRLTRRRRPVR